MIKNLKSVISLTVICAVVSVLLALTNNLTAPIIKEQESAAVNEALAVVLPGASDFSPVEIGEYKLPESITEIYSEKNGGYVFKMTTSGYASNFVILCGIDKDGIVKGATCISSNETLGVEKDYGDTLKETTLEKIDGVETVSGATKTTAAYKNAVKNALNAFVILNGGSVDLRDEAQILADNLSAALPQAEGKFSPVFITEDIKDIDSVYSAENGSGYVFVIGEEFIATNKDGKVSQETQNKTKVEDAAKAIINSKLNEIDITKYSDMPTQVAKAYKTESGNYVFELKAAGFGINGDAYYYPSGEYIDIKVSATKEGKIISCLTTAQKKVTELARLVLMKNSIHSLTVKPKKTILMLML